MDKSSQFNNKELVATQQILLPIISMKVSLIISERKIDFLSLVTSIYLIMQFGTWWKRCSTRTKSNIERSKGFQQQYQMHGIDWQKKFMNNSIDQWFMRLEKVVEEGGGHIVQLISGTDTVFQRGYSNWLGSKVYFH